MNKKSAADYLEEKFKNHQEVIDLIDETVKKGPWQKSAFLKATSDKLMELRNYIDEGLHISDGYMMFKGAFRDIDDGINRAGQLTVYVSVYNANGSDLNKWAKVISDLAGKVVTRSVYRVEEDMREMLRTKSNLTNEGYVVLYINPTDMVQTPEPAYDKFGHELLVLKDKSIRLDNVQHFKHLDKMYELKYNRLIEVQDESEADNSKKDS